VEADQPIEFEATRRGALVGTFTDRYGAHCSLQESSYLDEECLWLGIEVDAMGEPLPSARMHVTRDLARRLGEALLHFATEGVLGSYDASGYRVGQWVIGIGKDNYGLTGRIVELQEGRLIKVQNAQLGSEFWTCTWKLATRHWLPTNSPPEGVSLFEHLEADV
jgi:hypothetical protein